MTTNIIPTNSLEAAILDNLDELIAGLQAALEREPFDIASSFEVDFPGGWINLIGVARFARIVGCYDDGYGDDAECEYISKVEIEARNDADDELTPAFECDVCEMVRFELTQLMVA